MKHLNAIGIRVLIIPDLHIPYHHIDSFNFLKAIKEKYLDGHNYGVINLGDEIDGHCISFHDNDPDLPFSPSSELEKSVEKIQHLYRLFPKMYLCESNHGSLIYRRAKKNGIPLAALRTYQEILQTPKWLWFEDYLLKTKLGEVYLCHGKTATTSKLSLAMGVSAVQGHFHGKFQIVWNRSVLKETFDLYSGCLIDRQSLAFAYGKNHLPKPILGCSLIAKSGYPTMIKMDLDSNNRWTGNLP